MSRLRSMLWWDCRLQARYGFYAVYAVLTVAFVLGLRALGPDLRTEATVLLVVTDPTVLGFYFVAAMVLFEKREGVLDALVTSPLGDRGYLLSKVVSLTLLATVAATLVAVVGHGVGPRIVWLVVGVALSAPLFVLVGIVAVARFDSINAYFISAVGWGTVLFLPLFGYVGLVDTRLFYLLPVQPVLVLVEAGLRPTPARELAYGVGYLLVGNALAYRWARRSFRRHVVRGGTPGRQLGRASVPEARRDGADAGETNDADGPNAGAGMAETHSPLTAMVLADLRNWARDPMLAFAAVGPLALALVLRFGAPVVTDLAAGTVALARYYPVLTAAMAAFGPQIYGFVVGMFVLEDRESGVLTAFRTSPLTGRGYLLYRGATAYVLAFVATLPALAAVGLVSVPLPVLIGAAAVGALGAPLIALAFGTLAANTIEGLALSKLLNLLVLVPVVVVAVVPEPVELVAGILPPYWPVKAVVAGVDGGVDGTFPWQASLVIGVVVHAAGVLVLLRAFERRVES